MVSHFANVVSHFANYNSVVHWRKNLFKIPLGRLMLELSRLCRVYASDSMLGSVALKVAMNMLPLLLQRPHPHSKVKEDLHCLERRLPLWIQGDIAALVAEGQAIQDRLGSTGRRHKSNEGNHRTDVFAKLVMKDNTKSAVLWLDDSSTGGPLALCDICDEGGSTVHDLLYAKHPLSRPAMQENVVSSISESEEPHSVIFDRLHVCGSLVKTVVMSMKGAAGPSWMDAAGWRRLCSCYK